MFQMRQIKLRSLEDAVYTTQYNRVRFDIQPDDMSTDLSQSYLLIRLILASVASPQVPSIQYTDAEIQSWIAQNVMVSFGHEDQSYSPACLIKTARLVNKKTGSVVEEIQFANVLSQYLFQMTNDKETLSSQNLLTGTGLEIGKGSGITQSYSAFLQNPTSIRILLKDIFGCCNTSNFYLSETGGMELSFELEDRLPVLRTSPIAQPERIAFVGSLDPLVLAQYPVGPDLADFYDQYPDTMGANTNTQYDKIFVDSSNNCEVINAPRAGFKYMAEYFEPLDWSTGSITTLTFATLDNSDPDLSIANGLGFTAGNIIKLNLTWTGLTADQVDNVNGGVGVEPKILEYVTEINSVEGANVEGMIITLNNTLVYPTEWSTPAKALLPPILTSVEIMPPTFSYLTSVENPANPGPSILTQLSANTLILTLADLVALEKIGVVAVTAGTALAPTSFKSTYLSFEMALEANMGGSTAVIYPDLVKNQDSAFSSISSNLLVRLPYQGRAIFVKSITALPSDLFGVEFSDLGVNPSTGWSGNYLVPVQSGGDPVFPPELTPTAATQFYVLFFNSLAPGSLPDVSGNTLVPRVNPYSLYNETPIPLTLTYNVDRFEIVLIQQTKNPKMPMSMGCSTWRVEPQNIQYPQYQWSQQFSVTEPNCYNAVLLTPDYLSPALQLVSSRRNISRYRNSLNNIDFANRDTILSSNESDYPSSLYSDQLIDYFSNSQYPQRSLYGLREIAHSREPILSIPMKVYNAFANGQMVGNGGMPYTLQVNLFGDPSMYEQGTIKVGPVFLYKQCLKSWNE